MKLKLPLYNERTKNDSAANDSGSDHFHTSFHSAFTKWAKMSKKITMMMKMKMMIMIMIILF